MASKSADRRPLEHRPRSACRCDDRSPCQCGHAGSRRRLSHKGHPRRRQSAAGVVGRRVGRLARRSLPLDRAAPSRTRRVSAASRRLVSSATAAPVRSRALPEHEASREALARSMYHTPGTRVKRTAQPLELAQISVSRIAEIHVTNVTVRLGRDAIAHTSPGMSSQAIGTADRIRKTASHTASRQGASPRNRSQSTGMPRETTDGSPLAQATGVTTR